LAQDVFHDQDTDKKHQWSLIKEFEKV